MSQGIRQESDWESGVKTNKKRRTNECQIRGLCGMRYTRVLLRNRVRQEKGLCMKSKRKKENHWEGLLWFKEGNDSRDLKINVGKEGIESTG